MLAHVHAAILPTQSGNILRSTLPHFYAAVDQAAGEGGSGGTDDNAIARLHAVQGGAFAVVGLNVAYDKAARGVIGAGGDDPVFWVWLGWVLHGRAPVVSWRFTGGGTDRSRQEVYDRRCALNAQVPGGQDAHLLRTVR